MYNLFIMYWDLFFQIPLCVITPGPQVVRSSRKALDKFSGTPLYFDPLDEEEDDYFVPMVIIYNGSNHFVGTYVLSSEEQEMFKCKLFLEHLQSASDLYFDIDFNFIKKAGLKESMADLVHNVQAVKGLLTSRFTKGHQAAVTISSRRAPNTSSDAPNTSANAPNTPPSQDSGEEVILDQPPGFTSQASQGQVTEVTSYEKKKKKRKRHSTQEREKLYPCSLCNIAPFTRSSDLKDHMKSKHSSKKYKCKECSISFEHKRSFVRHCRQKHDLDEDEEYHCTVCKFGSNSKHEIKRHMIKRHGKGYRQQCKHCKKIVSLLGTRRHDSICRKRVDVKSRVIKCPAEECDKTFITARAFKSHDEIKHKGTGGFPCEKCGNILSTRTTLKNHLKAHISDDEDDNNYTYVSGEGSGSETNDEELDTATE